jgi:lipoyl(octanoyl) transferase
MQEVWRLLPLAAAGAGHAMALDEALLERTQDDAASRPTLRLYVFEPAALSLGYFQDLFESEAARARLAPGTPVVRRFTGGGAIHHASELTFSIAAPLTQSLYAGAIAPSYERVHAAIARALSDFGVHAEPRGSSRLASDRAGTGMCFHHSSSVDLVWPGPDGALAKGVGSAQRRRAGRVLHHGSIKLGRDPLERGVATVREQCDAALLGEFARSLSAAFAEVFDLRFELGAPSKREAEHVAARASWFGSADNLAPVRLRPME